MAARGVLAHPLTSQPPPLSSAHSCSAKKGGFFAGLVSDENSMQLCEMRGGEKERRKRRELRVGGLNCPFQGEFLDDGTVWLTPDSFHLEDLESTPGFLPRSTKRSPRLPEPGVCTLPVSTLVMCKDHLHMSFNNLQMALRTGWSV